MQYIFNSSKRNFEVIIVDGGSTDDTVSIAKQYPAQILQIDKKQRAAQMNAGVLISRFDILYFVHADVIPPIDFIDDILKAITNGNKSGWFSYKFDKQTPLLNFNSSFTKRDGLFTGAGDQTLFILKEEFLRLGGYDESCEIMEDFDLTRKIKKKKISYTIITNDCIVSTRKYNTNSWVRVNFANLLAFIMFLSKSKNSTIKKIYKGILNPY